MAGAGDRRAYNTLDGMRAIGAFLVVTRHVPDFFGHFRAPESFLAVDLFYLVSGFVVAHAYGERLKADGQLWAFFKTRIIRLYPLYIIGLAIGVADAVHSILTHGWWTWQNLAIALGTGLLMIPGFPGLPASGGNLDGPIWTLLYELIANMSYAALVKRLTNVLMFVIMAVCAGGLIFAEIHAGALDVGYNKTDQWAALARVGFSFFAGVMVFKYFSDKKTDSEWMSWVCMAALAFLLMFKPPLAFKPYYEVGAVVLAFPALVAVAARFEPGALTGRVFAYLGLLSYGVYIIHQPLGHVARYTLETMVHVPRTGWVVGLWAAGFLAFLVGVAAVLDKVWDAPVRKLLRARFMNEKRA
jgi:peptidoglycan/LPS O-acetylase OafA/YrhL